MTSVGHMDDMGILPGTMKLLGEAGTPKAFEVPGVEKSSISLLNMIPVRAPTTLEPKLVKKKERKVQKGKQLTDING